MRCQSWVFEAVHLTFVRRRHLTVKYGGLHYCSATGADQDDSSVEVCGSGRV